MQLRITATLALLALTATAAPALATENVIVRRLEGANRYETAAAIARATFPIGTEVNVTVARGDAFPDALSGVNQAGSYYGPGRGPILLSPRDALPVATEAFFRDYPVFDGYIIGTGDVLSARVGQQVADLSVRDQRIGGRDRYETNFLSRVQAYNGEGEFPREIDGLTTAFLVSGAQYADASSVGPVSYTERLPLLLTARDSLSPSTRQSLQYSGPVIKQVIVVGGTSAVSEQVVRDVEALGINVRRIAGANRQETAVEVFKFAEQKFGWTLEHVNLARGDDFPDAIAGGPHGGEEKAPIFLTASRDDLSAVTRDFLRERSNTISTIDVFGSETAVSETVVKDARAAALSP